MLHNSIWSIVPKLLYFDLPGTYPGSIRGCTGFPNPDLAVHKASEGKELHPRSSSIQTVKFATTREGGGHGVCSNPTFLLFIHVTSAGCIPVQQWKNVICRSLRSRFSLVILFTLIVSIISRTKASCWHECWPAAYISAWHHEAFRFLYSSRYTQTIYKCHAACLIGPMLLPHRLIYLIEG